MNNRLTYCGLVGARISASEKDLPVLTTIIILFFDLNKNVKETKNYATSNYSKMPFIYFFK